MDVYEVSIFSLLLTKKRSFVKHSISRRMMSWWWGGPGCLYLSECLTLTGTLSAYTPYCPPSSPRSPTSPFTKSTALLMLSLSVTFSRTVFSPGEAVDAKSDAPSSVRHAAMTWKPFRSSCLASRFPKPLSQPVMNTCFWLKPSTL